jgi:HEAT repeat protein
MLAPPPLPRTLEASLRDLSSHRPESRASAVVDLVRHARGDAATRARAIPSLERALADLAPTVRAAAAVGLGDLAAREALPGLLVAIEDPDAFVRQMAINALGEIGDGRAATRLARALEDDRPEVRYQAVIAYPRVAGDEREGVRRALERAFADPDDSVRYIALRTAEERADAGKGDPRLVERAVPSVKDAVPHVALAAAIFVAKAGREEGRELVLRVAVGTDGRRPKGAAREDENEAILVAGDLGLREAAPALERRAWGLGRLLTDTCAWSARTALARMGHPRALAEIKADLTSPRRATAEAAVVAAGRARLAEAAPILRTLGADVADPALVAQALEAIGGRGDRP